MEIIIGNHIIVYKLLAWRWTTWNYTFLCKLFVIDRNTWYLVTVRKKKLFKNYT